ncbi:MAG: PDZ domain-containing protein [Chloroflexi bacterium]|nr:PDZ domain-containing protein [Chloroflexota bacterium]
MQGRTSGAVLVALVIAVAAGAVGGVAGGVTVLLLDDDPATAPPDATALPVCTATEEPPTPAPAGDLDAAIHRALEAVVTVVADSPASRDESGRMSQQRSLGSGVVIDAAGYVMTNYHVVSGAAELSVVLSTGEQRPARLVAHDAPYTDFAVLAIPSEGLRRLRLGDSDELRLGQPVIAVAGAGFTSGNSVKVGVVSGLDQSWVRNGVVLEDLVQTDAAVNIGDSGGALINAEGELVGLLTTVVRETPTGLAVEGVSFSQSSNSLRPILENIIALGVHPRPRLGIEHPFAQHLEMTPELADAEGIPRQAGALVTSVARDSSAAAAGVQPGDLIVAVNGLPVDLSTPLVNRLKALELGQVAELTVLRGGQQLVIPVTPRLE